MRCYICDADIPDHKVVWDERGDAELCAECRSHYEVDDFDDVDDGVMNGDYTDNIEDWDNWHE